jgi:hypothetical protein
MFFEKREYRTGRRNRGIPPEYNGKRKNCDMQ